jgi:competence protein ComEC
MILGVIAIVISMFLHAPFSIFFALPAWTVLVTMTSIIDWWSKIPFVSLPVDARVSVVVCVIVFGTLARMFRRLPRSFERNLDAFDVRRVCIIGVVLFVLCSIHLGVIAWRSGRFTSASTLIFVFDVGQGDAMLIDGSTRDIIIDGGSTRFGLLEAMALVRFPWERHVDVVIATHPHADHVVGLLELIARYDINEIVKNGSMYDIPAAEAFEAIVDDRSDIGVMGDAWNIGSDGVVEILWPRDPETDIASDNVHTRSIVAKLSVHDSVMLFMGDAERDIEEALLANDDLLLPSVDVLKVGHHGSDTSTSQAFLDVVTPATAIISVGEENIYEHPSPFVLGRLTSMGALVLRTDQNGTVRFDF